MIDIADVQLILAPEAWEQSRPLLVDRDRYLTGPVRWQAIAGPAGEVRQEATGR